jgi:hypothetical protein
MREQRTPSSTPAHRHGPVTTLSPAERSLRARLAAYAMHARHDARRTSANGRAAFLARFEQQVDPHGRLDPEAVPGVQPPGLLATWIARGPVVQVGRDAARSSAMGRPGSSAAWTRSPPKAAPSSRRVRPHA